MLKSIYFSVGKLGLRLKCLLSFLTYNPTNNFLTFHRYDVDNVTVIFHRICLSEYYI